MREWTELHDGFAEHHEADLTSFIESQRWFGGKGLGIAGIGLVDHIVLREEPRLVAALIEVRSGAGRSDIYQLVLQLSPNDDGSSGGALVTVVGETAIYEASSDPRIAQIMTHATGDGTILAGKAGEMRFRAIRDIMTTEFTIRTLDGEQSHTSVVLNEWLLLKLYRRLEAGANPELELLLYLTEHEFANVPQFAGWYSYSGADLRSTLGLAQRYIPDAIDGWSLGREEVGIVPLQFLARLERLGTVIGDLHCILASDANDPSFAPEDPAEDSAAILGAKLEGQIDDLTEALPQGRSDELRTLARTLTKEPISGKLIRTHGDLHLGQVLWTGGDWLVIDFEGEPTRSLAERRQKLHPLRDIAGLLRSLAYLVAAFERENLGVVAPNWEQQAGQRFLSSYRTRVASAGFLPRNLEVQARLLRIFALEKMLYELDYEIRHRPDWLPIPLAGIDRLLAEQTG